jgi:signal transduction histidine kinase
MFAKALRYLEGLSQTTLLLLLLGLTFLIGYCDYLSGSEITFSGIYLFPIVIAAWFLGRPAAYAWSVLCSILWLTGDIATGTQYSSVFIPVWNLAIRFGGFAVSLELTAALRSLHYALEARASERAAKLTTEIAAREALERELLQISEREQRRVGHDIHDGLCQHLTGTAFAGQVLAETLKSQGSAQAESALKIVELIEQGIALSRGLARGLNLVELSSGGLMEALEDFASSTSDLFKVSCRFECPFPVPIHDADTAGHIFRIAQEAVGNAIKHGHAKDIVVQLEASNAGKILRVRDDGAGISPFQRGHRGMGLRIMSYRAEVIGAKLDIRRGEKGGTVVTCVVPADESHRHEQDEIENIRGRRSPARA